MAVFWSYRNYKYRWFLQVYVSSCRAVGHGACRSVFHISLKSWTQKGHNCETGRSDCWLTVCVCSTVCRSARLWCFLGVSETDCLAYRELTQFLQGKGSISHLVLSPHPPIWVSKGKRERVWVSWMACYCKSILNWLFWHMALMLCGCPVCLLYNEKTWVFIFVL